jgi:signal transduction histidine kinase
MSEADLAEVIGAFNEVTAKLQSSHEALRGEVAGLRARLREANEQLERSRRLAALGEMAAGIAHEVRNPLGSIRLYARMLDDDLAAMPEQRLMVRKVAGAVRTVDAVVNDVLAFAREVRVRPEAVDAAELIGRIVDEVLEADKADGPGRAPVNVRRRDVSRRPGTLICDPALTQRALSNVLANAVQAVREREAGGPGSPGAPLEIITDLVRATTVGPDGLAETHDCIVVTDSGTGVSAEVMGRMFNPFFTTRAAGTGLGLAIVHRIMDAHGGGVAVRNRDAREGTGATVELRFPVQGVGQQIKTRQGGGVNNGGQEAVVMVENAA